MPASEDLGFDVTEKTSISLCIKSHINAQTGTSISLEPKVNVWFQRDPHSCISVDYRHNLESPGRNQHLPLLPDAPDVGSEIHRPRCKWPSHFN